MAIEALYWELLNQPPSLTPSSDSREEGSSLADIQNRLKNVEIAQSSFSIWDSFRAGVGEWAALHAMEALMGGLSIAIAFLIMLLQ